MTKYQHYKGGIYTLITFAQHTENNEDLVIYQNKDGEVFARPHDMFFGDVEVDGIMVERFKEIKPKEIIPAVSTGRLRQGKWKTER